MGFSGDKWPRLLVVGEPVSEQQANEILIRTDDWSLMSNDRNWVRACAGLAGIEIDEYERVSWRARDAFRAEIGALRLEYLDNSRITSSWIGGPHGWCDWDGTVAASTFNIGKWPTSEEVLADWTAIAEAFPYLALTAQLVGDEGEDDEPFVEYRMAGGRVEVDEQPNQTIPQPGDFFSTSTVPSPLRVGGERGVSLDRLRSALEQVRGHSDGAVD